MGHKWHIHSEPNNKWWYVHAYDLSNLKQYKYTNKARQIKVYVYKHRICTYTRNNIAKYNNAWVNGISVYDINDTCKPRHVIEKKPFQRKRDFIKWKRYELFSVTYVNTTSIII